MNDKILNIEVYCDEIRKYFKSIIEGRFFQLHPYTMTDDELMYSLPYGTVDKSRGLDFANNLCIWLTIGKSRKMEYYEPYTEACLCNSDGKVFYVNYSRYKYPLSIKHSSDIPFDNNSGINTIDEKAIDPDSFFPKYYGDKIFYICSIKGIDNYNREKLCSFFAKENISPDYIRKYILKAQIMTIKTFLNNPLKYNSLPSATIISEINGKTIINRDVIGCPCMYDLAKKIYIEEFSNAFLLKENELNSNYSIYC